MIVGPRTREFVITAPRFDDDAAFDARLLVDGALVRGLEGLEDVAVALEQWILLAGVDPPALEDFVRDPVTVVEEPLDRVGDLELAPRRRLDRRAPRRGCCGRRGTRRQARGLTAAARASRRAARRHRSRSPRRHRTVGGPRPSPAGSGLRRGRPLASRGRSRTVDELDKALLEHVVAEVHHEVVVAEEVAGDQNAVGEPERRVLGYVGDGNAPARAVTDRGADLLARCRRR